LQGHEHGFPARGAPELPRAGGADRGRPRQGAGLPAARAARPARRAPPGADRRRGGNPGPGVARGAPVAGELDRGRGRAGVRGGPRVGGDRAPVARLRLIRYVQGLRGPWAALQGGSGAAGGQRSDRVRRGDRWLVGLALLLTAVGMVMVYSAGSFHAFVRYGDSNHFLRQQIVRTLLGVAALFACSRMSLRRLESLAPWLLAGACALLALVAVIGHMSNGATR